MLAYRVKLPYSGEVLLTETAFKHYRYFHLLERKIEPTYQLVEVAYPDTVLSLIDLLTTRG